MSGQKLLRGVQISIGRHVCWLVPLAVYALLVWPLRTWIVDDAGITFAYARNFAHGYGLVSQPGLLPVEGFSNPLWVFLLAPSFLLHLFDPYITPKVISFLLVAATFLTVYGIMREITRAARMTAFVVLLFVAVSTPFLVWTTSGLENPLYCALIVALVYVQLRYLNGKIQSIGFAVYSGLVASAIALTRPDGIVFAGIVPVTLLVSRISKRRHTWSRAVLSLVSYAAVLACVYGGYLLFRLAYFGAWFPNTYYAKRGPTLPEVWKAITLSGVYLTKLRELFTASFGPTIWFLPPALLVVLFTILILRKIRSKEIIVLTFAVVTAGFVHMVMPHDWMGEFRFATPYFVLLYVLLAALVSLTVTEIIRGRKLRSGVAAVVSVALLVVVVSENLPRLQKFTHRPIVPFYNVGQNYGVRYNHYADLLDADSASILVPDVGGTLYYSKLRVYDLGGLCDAKIARTWGKDQDAFHDYIFEEAKPTFMHIAGTWSAGARFDSDPRFRRDYLPMYEYEDGYLKQKYGISVQSGDFIRKDAVDGKSAVFEEILAEHNGN